MTLSENQNGILSIDSVETMSNLIYSYTPSPYRAVNTLLFGHKNQSVNAV